MEHSIRRKSSIRGWGGHPTIEAQEFTPNHAEGLAGGNVHYHPRGLGRSYGDAALPGAGHASLNTKRLDHFIDFDEENHILTAESGVSLEKILEYFVPKGYFLPVTPGTKFVSLGGAVAGNVHGKNHHHHGSIEHFVKKMRVSTPIGTFDCSPDERSDLFYGTIGGYGMTGLIEQVSLQLKPVETSYFKVTKMRARNLEHLFELFELYDHYTFSMAWMDTLARGSQMGRSVLMMGEHATLADLPQKLRKDPLALPKPFKPNIPFYAPEFLLNRLFLSLFNLGFYTFNYKNNGEEHIEDYDTFFYPLDFIHNWYKMYGRAGFLQYQMSIPDPHGREGMREAVEFLTKQGIGSFLSVVKRCGEDEGIIPFCQKGYTLALDIPFRPERLKILDEVDKIVLKYGGRVYLGKDSRLSADMFRKMYPKASEEWKKVIDHYNPERTVSSHLAERLKI